MALGRTHSSMARVGCAFSSAVAFPLASRCVPLRCAPRRASSSIGGSWLGRTALILRSVQIESVQRGARTANTSMLLGKIANVTTSLFPVWTVVCSWLALKYPAAFVPLTSSTVVQTALSVLMLSTGMTLTPAQIRGATGQTRLVFLSLVGCYVLMPALSLMLARLFSLPAALQAGLVLVGIISGGQASNLCTLIARGDVALSVTMTTASTVLSSVALPLLSALLLSQVLYVQPLAMAKSLITMVLIPVLLGATVAAMFQDTISKVRATLPVVGIAAVMVLILGPVSKSAVMVEEGFSQLALPVTLLHVLGGVVGFLATLALSGGRKQAVTVAFETGFKSPALSFVLAQRHFGDTLVALPSVISIVLLAPLAALCAVLLRARGTDDEDASRKRLKKAAGNAVWPVAAQRLGEETREHKMFCVRVDGERVKTVRYETLSGEIARARRRGRRVSVWRSKPSDDVSSGEADDVARK